MIGQTLSHFKITAKLGEGGMGEVYRAQDTKLGREVAIKVLPETVAGDADRLARFQREARLLAALDHPNIAAIHGLEEADGRQLLVMQLVEGETLKERIQRGKVPLEEALPIALHIAEALESAHDKGIVHRDLKPANVKLSPEGQVKVLDFGLAKVLEEEAKQADMANSPTLTAAATQAGIILGTAAYMSPEQAAGQVADRRSDIWSFGVVLTEMLSGRQQFQGQTVSHVLAAVLQKEPDWDELAGDVPQPILGLVQRCLRKEPRQRLQAIGDARILLEEYLADPTAFAPRPAEPVAAAGQPLWKRLLPWAVTALVAVGLGAALWTVRPEPEPTRRLSLRLPDDAALFSGYGSSAVISPDGERIAYVLNREGRFELHIRSRAQWEGMLLAGGSLGSGTPYHPFFSPDGKWLGYVTPQELKKAPVTGGSSITLCQVSLSRGASWGPDGTIIFAPSPSSGLFRVSAAGGEPQPLTELAEGEASHRWPQVLPGGRGVLFTSHSHTGAFDNAAIEVLNLKTMERTVLHRGGTYGRYVASGHVVYAHDRTLFAMPFDLGKLQATGFPVPVIEGVRTNASQGGAHFSVSRDGSLVYVTGQADELGYEAVWVDREGGATPLWPEPQVYRNPRLSPDGTRLAVDVSSEQNRDIWIYDIERQVPTRLTFEEGDETMPVWSPDGQYVVYASAQGGSSNLYRKPADGSGEAERLTDSPHAQFPWSFSPDGKTLAYHERHPETNWDIWLLPLDGEGDPEPFLATQFGESEPAFSPDGRWIAYDSDESGPWDVYVRPASGGRGKWQVSSGGGDWVRWSSDGRALFYHSGTGVVSRVPVETEGGTFRTGRPAPVFDTPFFYREDGGSYFDVARDGQSFVMFRGPDDHRTEVHEHLQVVLNWFDELERVFSETQ